MLPQALSVVVADQYANPVSGVAANFSDGGAGGSFSYANPRNNQQHRNREPRLHSSTDSGQPCMWAQLLRASLRQLCSQRPGGNKATAQSRWEALSSLACFRDL